MKCLRVFPLILLLSLSLPWLAGAADEVPAEAGATDAANEAEYFEDDWLADEEDFDVQVADPLEPVNRMFFYFNDKLYFWVLKPLARTYSLVAPKPARKCVGNFFYNLRTPIRLVNNLLQGKFVASGTELSRFVVNTTVGVAGLWDPARNWFDLKASEEDFGQTLGKYGIGAGFYLCWPVLGPSNVRDSFGLVGDYFLDPISYLGFNDERDEAWAFRGGHIVNRTSLSLGDYEDFKSETFDPYSALRDAYSQQRRAKIKDSEF